MSASDVLAQLRAAVAGNELAAAGAVAALLLAYAARWTKVPEVGGAARGG